MLNLLLYQTGSKSWSPLLSLSVCLGLVNFPILNVSQLRWHLNITISDDNLVIQLFFTLEGLVIDYLVRDLVAQ